MIVVQIQTLIQFYAESNLTYFMGVGWECAIAQREVNIALREINIVEQPGGAPSLAG